MQQADEALQKDERDWIHHAQKRPRQSPVHPHHPSSIIQGQRRCANFEIWWRPFAVRSVLSKLREDPEAVKSALGWARISLDTGLFAKNVRTARRGAAGGPSGTTVDHHRMVLESDADTAKFWRLPQDLARAAIPEEILGGRPVGSVESVGQTIGGAFGASCVEKVRRLVARTIAQQFVSNC